MKMKSSFKDFTRGGQIILHNARMTFQIVKYSVISCILAFLLSLVITWFALTPSNNRYLISQWLYAKIAVQIFGNNVKQSVNTPTAKHLMIESRAVIGSPTIKKAVIKGMDTLVLSSIISLLIGLCMFWIIFRNLSKQGRLQAESQQIRGDNIQDQKQLKKELLRNHCLSDIMIGDLPLPKNFETRHILIHGTTGSGKSVCIREFLDQIRVRGDKALVYDKGCDYIKDYFRQDEDIILNPLDARGQGWHLWDECSSPADYDSLAAALMPLPPGTTDPFWISAARTIFSAATRQMQDNPKRSMNLLLKALLTADLATMGNFLKGTEAETLVSEKIEKTAISIKSVLTTYVKCLQYVTERDNNFSIRNWIKDDSKSNWLFISSVSNQHETLKPLISMWLDIAANALMSLPPSPDRRIWMIFDELPSLQRLPYLPEAFAEARKFGGCLVAGMQSISQLRKIYGNHAAEEISNLCNTRIFFRDPSFETAQWVSRELGERELEQPKENISYSESAMRSGISISNQRLQQQIISVSEIMQLNDLEAYIRLLGNFPLTKIKLTYKKRESIADSFISVTR